jgi:hypothetical protein
MMGEVVQALIRNGVPMIRKTFPVQEPWKVTITKRDQFFRLNGKIVSRNFAVYVARSGEVEIINKT